MKSIFFFGTRPEALKLSQLVKELREYGELFNPKISVSFQHGEMPDYVMEFFEINPAFYPTIMKQDQNICDILTRLLKGMRKVIDEAGRATSLLRFIGLQRSQVPWQRSNIPGTYGLQWFLR